MNGCLAHYGAQTPVQGSPSTIPTIPNLLRNTSINPSLATTLGDTSASNGLPVQVPHASGLSSGIGDLVEIDGDLITHNSVAEFSQPVGDSIHSAFRVLKDLASGKDLLAPYITLSERKW